jgi:predicted Zn-dependent protease
MTIDEIRTLIKSDKQLASQQIDEILQKDADNIAALELKVQILEAEDKIPEAINRLNRIIQIDADNKDALAKKELLLTILKYRNSDIYANTNLSHDPWLD